MHPLQCLSLRGNSSILILDSCRLVLPRSPLSTYSEYGPLQWKGDDEGRWVMMMGADDVPAMDVMD